MLPILAASLVLSAAAHADITLVGKASIPGAATDKSGLEGALKDGTPKNRLGSFGSGIAWTGQGVRYIAVDDRGPGDGAVPFRARCQTFDIKLDLAAVTPLTVELVSTTLLSDPQGLPLVGAADAFNTAEQAKGLRLDLEGIRVSPRGTIYTSDEYGPWFDEFSPDGRLLRRMTPPARFMVSAPAADPAHELPPYCTSGRQPNRGAEGLAISPDGATLTAIMQSPLIQDGALNEANERIGTNIRILQIPCGAGVAPAKGSESIVAAAQTREFLYELESPKHGVNELLAIGATDFLVLERDGKGGKATKGRALYRISIAGATDISAVASLPSRGAPAGVKPVSKKLFLDFLDSKFGLAGASMPEKIEGLAFGPDLPGGRHLLIVTTDNDLRAEVASEFWAFAIDAADLPGYTPQSFKPAP